MRMRIAYLGENQNLASIAGIRERLGISNQARSKDSFTADTSLRTKAASAEDRAILRHLVSP